MLSRRSSIAALTSVLLLVGAAIFAFTHSEHDDAPQHGAPAVPSEVIAANEHQLRRRLQSGDRPVIYTYWEQPARFNPKDDTMDLIENWQKAWYDMGWEPRVLTPQDALRLPEYNPFMEMLVNPEMLSEQSVASYRRWLAMAASGGGWMADYTTFPLNHFLRHGRMLPNDGQLTVYMGTNPTLVSGTAEEYYRVAKHMGATATKMVERQMFLNENYPEQANSKVIWSDKVALGELKKEGLKDFIKSRNDVMSSKAAEGTDDWGGVMNCNPSVSMRSVAFMGLKATEEENRGTIARKFVNKWRSQCEMTQVADDH